MTQPFYYWIFLKLQHMVTGCPNTMVMTLLFLRANKKSKQTRKE